MFGPAQAGVAKPSPTRSPKVIPLRKPMTVHLRRRVHSLDASDDTKIQDFN